MNRLIRYLLFLLAAWLVMPLTAGDDATLAQIEHELQKLRAAQFELFFPEEMQALGKQLQTLKNEALPTSQASQRATGIRLVAEINTWQLICAKLSRELEDIVSVRERCILMDGVDFAQGIFSKGDQKLRQAARDFVSGDPESMRLAAAAAGKFYLQAELKTIRDHVIGNVRIEIQESENLQAQKYLPKSYRATQNLLREVESMQRNAVSSNDLLFQKTRQLMLASRKLQTLLYTVHRFRDNAGSAEDFLLALNEKSDLLANELDIELAPDQKIQEKLQVILNSVGELRSSNARLFADNQELRHRNSQIRTQLLSYQTVSEREDFLETVLTQFTKILARPVERRQEFITIRYDSLRETAASLTGLDGATEKALSPLVDALKSLPATDIMLQLKVPEIEAEITSKARALRQAKAIEEYLRQRTGLVEEIHALGETYQVSPEDPAGSGRLTVVINIRELLASARLGTSAGTSTANGLKATD